MEEPTSTVFVPAMRLDMSSMELIHVYRSNATRDVRFVPIPVDSQVVCNAPLDILT